MAAAYRDPATPHEEVLATYAVSTLKGGEAVGCLGGIVIVFLVTFVVSLVAGAPPEVEPWVWTFPVAAFLFGVPAGWLWHRRRRTLTVFRRGGAIHVSVTGGGPTLALPVVLSGSQTTLHMRGVPLHHVYLKLVDPNRRGLLLREVRGAIHGAESNWLGAIDSESPAEGYEVSSAGDAARIRAQIETLNREATEPAV
jgi:hypothetical protein